MSNICQDPSDGKAYIHRLSKLVIVGICLILLALLGSKIGGYLVPRKERHYILIDKSWSTLRNEAHLGDSTITEMEDIPVGEWVCVAIVSNRIRVIFDGVLESEGERRNLIRLIRRFSFARGKGTFLYQVLGTILKKGEESGDNFRIVLCSDCTPDLEIRRDMYIPDKCTSIRLYCSERKNLSNRGKRFVWDLRKDGHWKVLMTSPRTMEGTARKCPERPVHLRTVLTILLIFLVIIAIAGGYILLRRFQSRPVDSKPLWIWSLDISTDQEDPLEFPLGPPLGDQKMLPIGTQGVNTYPTGGHLLMNLLENLVPCSWYPSTPDSSPRNFLLREGDPEELILGKDSKLKLVLKRSERMSAHG